MGVIGPRWTCPYCGTHFKYKSSAILCYETVCFTQERLEPEKPGVTFCKDCNRKLTQGSPSCVRCGKCARLRR